MFYSTNQKSSVAIFISKPKEFLSSDNRFIRACAGNALTARFLDASSIAVRKDFDYRRRG
jgi:hypothetical protein